MSEMSLAEAEPLLDPKVRKAVAFLVSGLIDGASHPDLRPDPDVLTRTIRAMAKDLLDEVSAAERAGSWDGKDAVPSLMAAAAMCVTHATLFLVDAAPGTDA